MTDHARRKNEGHAIIHRQDLLEWMLIRSALASVSMDESTFSKSARLTTGYFHRRHDVLVAFTSNGDANCNPVVNTILACQTCADIGASCPTDVRADCKF